MISFSIAQANVVGPLPISPAGIEVAGVFYSMDMPGLSFAGNSIHWDPALRGFQLDAGAHVTVHFEQPATMSLAVQAASSSAANCATPSNENCPQGVDLTASTPRRVIIDGNTIEERAASELIELDRYNRATAALRQGRWLGHQMYRPGGAAGAAPRTTS